MALKDSHKLISTQIEREIPQFIRMEYPHFVSFIKKYYEYLEQEGKPYHFIANILNYADVDRTSLEFLNKFGEEFLTNLPDVIYDQNNIATMVKNIEQYYSARGSEKAFDFLFRLFEFKDDPTRSNSIYYPSYDMLRVSDGKWMLYKSVKIVGPPSPDVGDTDYDTWIKTNNLLEWKEDMSNIKSGLLTGLTSGTKNVIDYAVTYESSSGINIGEIFIVDYDVIHTSNKLQQEDFSVTFLDGTTKTYTTTNVLSDINVTSSGKYYNLASRIDIESSGDGEDAVSTVSYISKGSVSGVSIVDGGIDYVIGDRLVIVSSSFGMGAHAIVSDVDSNGTITTIRLISDGINYDKMPSATVDSVNGTGAIIMLESDDIGMVSDTERRNFGMGYVSSETTLTFNTMIRIHSLDFPFLIGEHIVSGGAEGVIEYYDSVGGVLGVRMITSAFVQGDIITSSINGSTATVYDTSTATGSVTDGVLCNYTGRYINTDGHISSDKFIQDSYFYQMFSYMIKSRVPKEDWEDYIKDIHPSGTLALGYEDININLVTEVETINFISPRVDTTEFYKFEWVGENYHGGHINGFRNNTLIKQYSEFTIDSISNINNNVWDKTNFTFGSEITIT